MSTAIICAILVVFCFIGIRSTVKRATQGCCGSGGDSVKKVKAADRDLSHYPYSCQIEVDGMSCANCRKRVENAFNEREGYYASVDLKKKLADIHRKEAIDEQEIRNIIRRAGYQSGRVVDGMPGTGKQ